MAKKEPNRIWRKSKPRISCECPCKGSDKECRKCDGTGWIGRDGDTPPPEMTDAELADAYEKHLDDVCYATDTDRADFPLENEIVRRLREREQVKEQTHG